MQHLKLRTHWIGLIEQLTWLKRVGELQDNSVENIHPGAHTEKRVIHKTTQNMRPG